MVANVTWLKIGRKRVCGRRYMAINRSEAR